MINNNRGSVLLACVIITVLILAVVVQFSNWSSRVTKTNVQQLARQKALVNADTGIQSALQFLRTPQAAQLQSGVPFYLSSMEEGTTFYLTLTRQIANSSLIDIFSTGYYQLQQGGSIDPSGKGAQQASVRAQIQLRNVGDYFAASPGTLEIGYGSNLSSGVVYGRDLVFTSGASGPGTRVKAAYYLDSIEPSNYADFVTFLAPNQPAQVDTAPNLPYLDASMRNQYENMANSDRLLDNATLSGTVPPPSSNAFKVYYGEGTVHLGASGSSCTLNNSFLIYSREDIVIHNVVNGALGDASWPALMAEGNIYIADDAPDMMSIDATMVANGEIKALGPARSNGRLAIKGGLVAGQGISFGNVYAQQRDYTYQAPDPNLPLPFATSVTLYKVTEGKYNR
jgi:hypothetical protein